MKKYIFLFALLIILTLFFGYTGVFSFINLTVLILCTLAFFSFPKFNVLLFVAFLATNGLISTEYNLFGVLNIKQTTAIFAILSLLRLPVPKQYRNTTYQRIAIYFVILMFFSIILRTFKEVEFNLSRNEITYSELMKQLVKYSLTSVALIILITRFAYTDIRKIIISGLVISVILVSVSILLSTPLHSIGFVTNLGELRSENIMMAKRDAGFFMNEGDVNTAGGFLALIAGLIFSLRKSGELKINILLILSFVIIGILGTLSRAASLSIAGVLLVYLLQEKMLSLRSIGIMAGLIIITSILYVNGYFDLLIQRFSMIEETMSSAEDSRLGGWILYLKYIFGDVKVFLIGATENLYTATMLKSSGYFRVAHNFYISNFYYFGVLGAIIPISLIIKYMKQFRRTTNSRLLIWYTLFPFLMITNTTSDIGIFFPFILTIPFTPYLLAQPATYASPKTA